MEKIGNLLSRPLRELSDEAEGQPFRESSSEWIEAVEKIFGQFSMHYGAARMSAHWSGLDVDKTKAYWARKLSNLSRRQLGYALQHLPEHPPSVDDILSVARRCPPPVVHLLPYKPSQEDWQHGRDRITQIAKQFGAKPGRQP